MVGDRDILQLSPKFQQGEMRLGNILVTCNTDGSLSVKSLGGKIYDEGIMHYVYTVHDHDLWLQPSNDNSQKVRHNRLLLLVYRMMRKIYLLYSIQKWSVIPLQKKRNKEMTGYQT